MFEWSCGKCKNKKKRDEVILDGGNGKVVDNRRVGSSGLSNATY